MKKKHWLEAMVQSGRLHPSLILTGASETQRKDAALLFAKSLLCADKRACGSCRACRRIDGGIHPDVFLLEAEDGTHKVEGIRQFCQQMQVTSLEGGAKIGIVVEADLMTVGSSNAFLKMLEEPPPGRYFLLLTSKAERLIGTVRSRCLEVTLPEENVDALGTEAEFEKIWKTGDPIAVASEYSDREKATVFVSLVQSHLRNRILRGEYKTGSQIGEVQLFEQALLLEDRLRSNASPTLQIESFLRQYGAQIG